MSRDVVVSFDGDMPSRESIEEAIKQFFGGAYGNHEVYGGGPTWEKDRWFVVLPGTNPESPGGVRWIEVWPGQTLSAVWVMTRGQDVFTNALADGLARHLRNRFGGRIN